MKEKFLEQLKNDISQIERFLADVREEMSNQIPDLQEMANSFENISDIATASLTNIDKVSDRIEQGA